MSLSRSLRCVPVASKSFPLFRVPTRYLQHSSRLQQDDQEKSTKDIATRPNRIPIQGSKQRVTAAHFPPYSEEDREKLKEKYTPQQLAAIEAGEAAIDPQDIADQGIIKEGHMTLDYMDDFAKIDPVLDKPVLAPDENYDPNLRFKNDDEITEDLMHWVENLPENPDPLEWRKFEDNVRLMVGKEEAERNPQQYTAPELPKINDPIVRSVARMSVDASTDEMSADWARLSQQTGMTVSDMKRLRTKTLVMNFVSNQTRMGKVRSMYIIKVAGNRMGLLGVGEGKSTEVGDAMKQATINAVRNMQAIPRYEDRTIYGDVKAKVGATEVELFNRPPGSSFDPACFRFEPRH